MDANIEKSKQESIQKAIEKFFMYLSTVDYRDDLRKMIDSHLLNSDNEEGKARDGLKLTYMSYQRLDEFLVDLALLGY